MELTDAGGGKKNLTDHSLRARIKKNYNDNNNFLKPIAQLRFSPTNGKNISLLTHIDSSLLGGLIVKYGSKMIDTSIRTKLNNLELAMKGAN